MRKDMAKVVTEKPRRGHGNKSLKTARRLSAKEIDDWRDDESFIADAHFSSIGSGSGTKGEHWCRQDNLGVTRAKASRYGQYGWDSKEFSDLLGPLRAYLRKQVGRLWDDVYSELSATLDKRSLTGIHIWGHIRSDVNDDCWMGVSGTIYGKRHWFSTAPIVGLYVHPMTHRLCYAPEPRYRDKLGSEATLHRALSGYGFDLRRKERFGAYTRPWPEIVNEPKDTRPIFVAADWRIVDDLTVLQRINGSWFIHKFVRRDPMEIVGTTTILHRATSSANEVVMVSEETVPVYLHQRPKELNRQKVVTRQLGKRELRALKDVLGK